LLASLGKSSLGRHDTNHLSTGIEASAAPRPYEFGDTMNLDVSATLRSAISREGLGVPINMEYSDLIGSRGGCSCRSARTCARS
jgi:Ca-activated chloride channel family protein